MKKVVILIDGGFLRIKAKKAGKTYNPDFIEQFALACKTADEEILRRSMGKVPGSSVGQAVKLQNVSHA